jgi:endonuclease YncB( thermonuclease family)
MNATTSLPLLRRWIAPAVLLLASLACTFGFDPNSQPLVTPGGGGGGGSMPAGEDAQVVRVVDGDTIDVILNGQEYSIRYLGINTPERDESCYADARQANSLYVSGKTVRLVRDTENTDRFGRLLRYVWVDGVHVNQALIQQGYAEVVLYEPNRAFYNTFLPLEREARAAGRGCHPSGIFNDGSDTR